MGVPVSYETTVTAINFEGSESVTTVEDENGNKEEIKARFIVDGSGYGRVIPRLFNLDKPSSLLPRKALFTHAVDLNRSMDDEPNRITIIVHRKGSLDMGDSLFQTAIHQWALWVIRNFFNNMKEPTSRYCGNSSSRSHISMTD